MIEVHRTLKSYARTPLAGAVALLFALTACGSGDGDTVDDETVTSTVASIDASTADAAAYVADDAAVDGAPWADGQAISPLGYAFGFELDAQPLPSASLADAGFVKFALSPARLTVRNLVIDRPSPAVEVEAYLFFACDLLTDDPVESTTAGELIISRLGWPAEPERLIAPDGGYCVQRLAATSFADGIEPGGEVTTFVGVPDLGFVAPEAQQGRIETMLGTPLFVQFGIRTTATDADDDAWLYTERFSLRGDPLARSDDAASAELDDAAADEPPVEALDSDTTVPTSEPTEAPATTECPTSSSAAERRHEFDAPPPLCIDPALSYVATVTTNVGTVLVQLDAAAAPATVNNFVVLARYGYFDDTPCHRAISGFVVQCGDPTGTGLGGPGYMFADELPAAGSYAIGSVAMANSGPDTNGSQFFIVTGDDGAALPPNYSLFGTVIGGLDDTVVWMDALGTEGGPPREDILVQSVTISVT